LGKLEEKSGEADNRAKARTTHSGTEFRQRRGYTNANPAGPKRDHNIGASKARRPFRP
jgi:hypothetical protein